jgi:hypothetical protein
MLPALRRCLRRCGDASGAEAMPAAVWRCLRRYRQRMVSLKLLAPLIALGVTAPALAAAPAPTSAHSLFASRELWATVDACNPQDHPNTIGIRGSMPVDGHKGDQMFMRFQVQYYNATTKKWVYVAKGADSGFQQVASTTTASQSGRNFQLVPTSGPFRLRGVVSFQWRRGAHVVHDTSRITTAAHKSLVGSDPAGFSTATCKIG